jgi:hypothetical protein
MGRLRPRWGIFLGLSTALVVVPAQPAGAHRPIDILNIHPSHFNGDDRSHGPDLPGGPDGDAGETNEAQIASDRFDGVDRLWTLRALATPEAEYYEWYECDTVSESIWQPPGTCRRIAIDTTPVLSTPAPGVAEVAVFEATYDITPAFEFGRTFRTAACIDGPPPAPGPGHCTTDRTVVHFDDSSTTGGTAGAHPATDGGHIIQPLHGGAVPNGGFTAVAYTSETDIGRILFCLDLGTSATPPDDSPPSQGCDAPNARDRVPDDSPACTSVPAGADCWEVTIDPPDNSEFSLGIIEQDDPTGPVSSGEGDCEGDTFEGGDGSNDGDDCQLDKVYLTSVASPPPPPLPPPPGSEPIPPGTGAACPGFPGDARNQIVGSPGGDTLVGSPRPDVICGLGGTDVLRGRRGDDLLLGGRGSDQLRGGPGKDRCRGGPGRDEERSCEV